MEWNPTYPSFYYHIVRILFIHPTFDALLVAFILIFDITVHVMCVCVCVFGTDNDAPSLGTTQTFIISFFSLQMYLKVTHKLTQKRSHHTRVMNKLIRNGKASAFSETTFIS